MKYIISDDFGEFIKKYWSDGKRAEAHAVVCLIVARAGLKGIVMW